MKIVVFGLTSIAQSTPTSISRFNRETSLRATSAISEPMLRIANRS